MLLPFLLFLILFALLFLISRQLTNNIYALAYLLTQNKSFAIVVLTFLLLPGTIIHELSHFFFALILRVPTGQLSVFPTVEKDGEIKLGKLMLSETDPFRRTLIGIAPMIIGLIIIYLIGKYLILNSPLIPSSDGIHDAVKLSTFIGGSLTTLGQLTTVIGTILLVPITLTLFSSKKDLEVLAIAGPILFLLISSLYIIGVRVSLTGNLLQTIESVTGELNHYLIISLALDFIFFFIVFLLINIGERVLGRRIKTNVLGKF